MSIFSRRRKFRNLVSSAISTVVLSSCAPQVAQSFCFILEFCPDLKVIHVDIGLPDFVDDCCEYGEPDPCCCNENTFLFNTPSDTGRGCNIHLCSYWLVIDEKSNVRILHDDDFLNETKGINVELYPFPDPSSLNKKMNVPPGETSVSDYDLEHIIFKYVLGCRAFVQHFIYDKPYDVAKGISRSNDVVKLLNSPSKEYVELNEKLNRQDRGRIDDLRIYAKLIVEFYNKYSYKIKKILLDRGKSSLYVLREGSAFFHNDVDIVKKTLGVKHVYTVTSLDDVKGNFVEIPEKFYVGLLKGDKNVLLEVKKMIGS